MATTSITTSEHGESTVNTNIHSDDDDKKKKEKEDEESKKLQSPSTTNDQGDKIKENVDDVNQTDKKDTLSSAQSTNENKQSDQTNVTSDNKNEEKTVETTTKQESSTTIKHESSTSSNDTKKDESTSSVAQSNSKKDDDNAFPIEKGDAEHLTDFQRQKAKYFFNVNLDIENKEYVTWEDVDFYLLFHATAAGKEGSNVGDLEARLKRAARAFWEHVHDQIPLADGKRDKLTLDQFLDTWAGLIDYVVRTNQLPPIIHDLVKLGFELYSTDNNGDNKSAAIQAAAFDQLFQKMNLSRPFAIMAYKYLTENGTKPLDADKIDSIVKAVITSSDDEHSSHFLLPGFFKTIADNKNNENKNKNKPPSPVSNKEQSEVSNQPSTTPNSTPPAPPSTPASPPEASNESSQKSNIPPSLSTQEQKPAGSPPSSSQSQQQNGSSSSPPQGQKPAAPPSSPSQSQPKNGPSSPPAQGQKPAVPSSSQSQQQNGPSSPSPKEQKPGGPSTLQKQSSSTTQNGGIKSPTSTSSTNQQQNAQSSPPAPPQKFTIEQEDESIRRLLHYYHIDDGDLVEILGGSPHRLVLVHPERPLPPYIQQNKQLLERLHLDSKNVSSTQQNGSNVPPNKSNTNEKPQEATETKPKVTLEERLSSGEAQKGPTVPIRQEQKQDNPSSAGARQVYPQLSEAQQEEQRKQATLQATQPPPEEKKTTEDESNEKKDISRNDEDKIVAAVLKRLAPIVEQRVAAELRRIHSGDSDQGEGSGFIQFPFMLSGGSPFFAAQRGGPSSQESGQQQNEGDQGNGPREGDFGGPAGGHFIPPQLLMAMMSDLARGGIGGEISGFPSNMPPPHLGPGGAPIGVEGFMMFVDDDQMMDGPPGYPSGPGRRFQ